MINMKKSMPLKGVVDEDDEEMMDEGDELPDEKESMGSKLLAMQNILDNLSDIVGDDMKPYIEQAKQSLHLQHEQAEGDKMGVENEEEHEMNQGMPVKSGLGVTIDMGAKPPMSENEDEDEEGLPKKGFLAILAKKMKK